MKYHLSIDGETMAVLRAANVTSDRVTLAAGELPRPLYLKVNKVLETLGGRWNRSARAHIFTTDPRPTLGLAVDSGAILDKKKASQAFYTPAHVAKLVVALAGVRKGMVVLEPSAGRGALAAPCLLAGAVVDCVEKDERSVQILCSTGYRVVSQGDFLKEKVCPNYDRVVMNPPFTGGQDIAHVSHAFRFLKPRGRLVAITSPGWEYQEQKRAQSFQDLVSQHGRVAERLPAGTFKEAGTDVATLVVVLERGAA